MQKILSGEYVLHFFARWDNRDDFTYLGVGDVVTFEDGAPVKNGRGDPDFAVKFTVTLQDAAGSVASSEDEFLINTVSISDEIT